MEDDWWTILSDQLCQAEICTDLYSAAWLNKHNKKKNKRKKKKKNKKKNKRKKKKKKKKICRSYVEAVI